MTGPNSGSLGRDANRLVEFLLAIHTATVDQNPHAGFDIRNSRILAIDHDLGRFIHEINLVAHRDLFAIDRSNLGHFRGRTFESACRRGTADGTAGSVGAGSITGLSGDEQDGEEGGNGFDSFHVVYFAVACRDIINRYFHKTGAACQAEKTGLFRYGFG